MTRQRSKPKKPALSGAARRAKEIPGRVSVILLNYDGGDHTSECLGSLRDLTYPAPKLEIIVVDNASSDGSAGLIGAEFPEVALIRSPENVGFSRGANLGASHATGEYLAFLNNDMRVDPSWLEPLLAAMNDSRVACAGSVIRNWEGSAVEFAGRRGDAFAVSYSAASDAPPEEEIAGGAQLFVSGGAMLLRATRFREASGFDSGYFMYQEDVDLCWRLWLSGHSCVLVPESKVFHRGGASSSRLSPEIVQGMSQANVLATLFKNLDDRAVRELLPLMTVYLLMRSAGQASGVEAFERAMTGFQNALPALLESRRAIQVNRVRTDAELFELTGHPLAFFESAGSFGKLLAAMTRRTDPNFSLTNAEGLQKLVGLWAARARDLIATCEEVFAIERARRDRMRQLELGARNSVIGLREEGIAFLQQTLENREAEISILRDRVERLSNRTKEYDSYVSFAKLVDDVAGELGIWDLSYEPRSREEQGVAESDSEVSVRSGASRYDIICFSIIDWEFRWQRPQQIMSQFADHGHRVFYISIARSHPIARERYGAVPLRENVWEIQLALPQGLNVYSGEFSRELAMLIADDLRALRDAFRITAAVSVVQVATWAAVAYRTRDRFGWPVVYDCMDEWDTFPGMAEALLTSERRLIREADLVVVTAAKLQEKYRSSNPKLVLARNAADFDRFHNAEPNEILEDVPHPIVGYFGAIADWFDLELMVRTARERPKYSFVLIGGVFGLDMRDLEDLPNVHILGQQPYERMPAYLRNFDVCIIPFKVNAITEATDPVKFYEFISQGKPVVSTTMPELYPYSELLYIAAGQEEFLSKLDLALRENDASLVERRIDLARANTWPARYETITRAISEVVPKASIIIVTFHNLDFTRQCIESVLTNTLHPNFEIIVVDNASTDGTREYLSQLGQEHDNVRVIFNEENVGFARANNQGLSLATGEYLVLLNNDTVVPRGWLSGLIRHLADPEIGLVNSVTNFSGNESRIEVPYTDMAGMEEFAARHISEHFGETFDIRVAAMYCVAMRRDVFESVGPLDEAFGVGMFEDDDYSHRMRLASYRVVCAEDVFVHHFGQASFKKLDAETYQNIWDANQTHFQKKWNMPWQPHTPRKREVKRSELPERREVELLFTRMARVRELAELEAARTTEVTDLQARLAAVKDHVDLLKHLLYVEQGKLKAIYELKFWKMAGLYWRTRSFLRGQRSDGTPALTSESFVPQVETAPPASGDIPAVPPTVIPDEPPPVAESQRSIVARPEAEKPKAYDVICFPIIEWGFRMQRPQQMMLQFAAEGHRVFYVSHQIRLKGDPYEVRKVAERIFEVTLRGSPRDVYVQSMTRKDSDLLAEGLHALRLDFGIPEAVTIVQLPFWTPLALRVREEFSWPVVYDMMDNMAAFSTSPKSLLEVEEKLLTSADLVVVTSTSLERQAQAKSSNVVMVRNAADYEHFAKISAESPFHTKKGRPLIGYYGAIADWFDVDLVAELARRHTEWDFVLIGSTVSSNVKRLRRLKNISLAGERPYADLPLWLERFDVAIIPFKITPLTEATNPVKAYEMLAGGKPVVSVPMPEVAAMAPLVRLASTVEEFETQIRQAIEFDYEPWIVEKRKAFARQNTWQRRLEILGTRIRETFGKALIVMDVPERKSSLPKVLDGVLDETLWPNLEVVVLTDESFEAKSDELARSLLERNRNVRLETISGGSFAHCANRLFAGSDADYLVILSAGAEVRGGWLHNLIRHLNRDEEIGVVLPDTASHDLGEHALAERVYRNDGLAEKGECDAPVIAFRREMLERIGPLDEDQSSALSAAVSYCRQARAANLKIVRALDALVIHDGRP